MINPSFYISKFKGINVLIETNREKARKLLLNSDLSLIEKKRHIEEITSALKNQVEQLIKLIDLSYADSAGNGISIQESRTFTAISEYVRNRKTVLLFDMRIISAIPIYPELAALSSQLQRFKRVEVLRKNQKVKDDTLPGISSWLFEVLQQVEQFESGQKAG